MQKQRNKGNCKFSDGLIQEPTNQTPASQALYNQILGRIIRDFARPHFAFRHGKRFTVCKGSQTFTRAVFIQSVNRDFAILAKHALLISPGYLKQNQKIQPVNPFSDGLFHATFQPEKVFAPLSPFHYMNFF